MASKRVSFGCGLVWMAGHKLREDQHSVWFLFAIGSLLGVSSLFPAVIGGKDLGMT